MTRFRGMNQPGGVSSKWMARWGIALIAATVFLACVAGVVILTAEEDFDLDPELIALADERWEGINELERDALCERLSTSEGRAQAFRELEQLLFEQEMDGAATDPEDAMDLLKPASTDAQRAREAKATEMVKYVQSKC